MVSTLNAKVSRETAYTFPRYDVCSMVPPLAMSILDVGCSNGALGAILRAACPGRSIIGIEMDPDFVEQARRQLDAVICANLNEFDWSVSLKDQQFDCIIFADVLEHLLDPSRHLREAQRHLAPGGSMVISLPNIRHVSSLYSLCVRGTFPQRDRGIFDKTHIRWFTIRDAQVLIAESGLDLERMSSVLRWGDIGGGLINNLLNSMPEAVKQFLPIRELLTYQFCMRVVKSR